MNTKRMGNILLLCFAFSFILILLSSAIFYGFNNSLTLTIETVFKVTPAQSNLAMFYIYAVAKLFALFVFLIPSLAIKLTEKKDN